MKNLKFEMTCGSDCGAFTKGVLAVGLAEFNNQTERGQDEEPVMVRMDFLNQPAQWFEITITKQGESDLWKPYTMTLKTPHNSFTYQADYSWDFITQENDIVNNTMYMYVG